MTSQLRAIVVGTVVGITMFIAVVAVLLAFVAQSRYTDTKLKVKDQQALIDQLIHAADVQASLNSAVLKHQKTLSSAVLRLLGEHGSRQLAAVP